MMICLPYDMKQIYAFFCSRYGNISYNDLINMGYEEFSAKLSSIPESEPIYKIFQSRIIDISKIKDSKQASNLAETQRNLRKMYCINKKQEMTKEEKESTINFYKRLGLWKGE